MYRLIFRKYLKWMAVLGRYQPQPPVLGDALVPRCVNPEFEAADLRATQYGDHYRGACVLVGILGIVVVFVAVTPEAFHIVSDTWLRSLSILKVCLMLWILKLVNPSGGIPEISKSWVDSRREAEELRYAPLKALKEELAKFIEAPERRTVLLRAELAYILNGPEGQISYNFSKGEMYKAIEHFSEKLSWVGFWAALVCAVGLLCSEFHLIPHVTELIYGTAALPALVGGVHGINGALKIGALAEEHIDMANLLQSLYNELEAVNSDEASAVLSIAERTYSQLVSRDVLWGESTAKSAKLKPA